MSLQSVRQAKFVGDLRCYRPGNEPSCLGIATHALTEKLRNEALQRLTGVSKDVGTLVRDRSCEARLRNWGDRGDQGARMFLAELLAVTLPQARVAACAIGTIPAATLPANIPARWATLVGMAPRANRDEGLTFLGIWRLRAFVHIGCPAPEAQVAMRAVRTISAATLPLDVAARACTTVWVPN